MRGKCSSSTENRLLFHKCSSGYTTRTETKACLSVARYLTHRTCELFLQDQEKLSTVIKNVTRNFLPVIQLKFVAATVSHTHTFDNYYCKDANY